MARPSEQSEAFSLPRDLRAMYYLCWEKAWLIGVITAAVVAIGVLQILRTEKTFTATTTVQVEEEQQKLVNMDARRPEERSDEVLKTIEQSFESPALLLRVAHRPEIANSRIFLPHGEHSVSDAQLERAVSGKISVKIRTGTRLIDVTAEDSDPAVAQRLSQLVVDEFIRASSENRVQVSQTAHEYLRQEADRLKAALAGSEEKLQRYKEQHQAASMEEKQNTVTERIKELNAKMTAAKAERLKLETDRAQLDQLAGQPPAKLLAVPSIAEAPEVVELQRKITEKEAEIATLSLRYKAEHPKYIAAANELADLKASRDSAILDLAARIRSAPEVAEATEKKLDEALRGQESVAVQLSEYAIPYNALAREVEADRALYESLLARMKQTGVEGVSPYAIRLIAPAILPDKPSKPNKRLILLVSLCGGLALSLTCVLGYHATDDSLGTVDQAERALGIPSLGAIPTRPKTTLLEARRLVVEQPYSALAEAFRSLRTTLLFARKADGYKSILFASASPGEGKSFCSINYAVALAHQGFRTLLIDADLRLPQVGGVFLGDDKQALGLSDTLLKHCNFGEAVHLTDIENLSVLPAGTSLADPAELVSNANLSEFLSLVRARFDRVVLDTAPVLAASETAFFVSQVDAVCLIVRARRTPAAAVMRALQILRESSANVAGLVLNGLPARGGYYYHYHAAGYGRSEVYGAPVTVVANR
jgi:succinoglycan biosynthesis transport protein ExoP